MDGFFFFLAGCGFSLFLFCLYDGLKRLFLVKCVTCKNEFSWLRQIVDSSVVWSFNAATNKCEWYHGACAHVSEQKKPCPQHNQTIPKQESSAISEEEVAYRASVESSIRNKHLTVDDFRSRVERLLEHSTNKKETIRFLVEHVMCFLSTTDRYLNPDTSGKLLTTLADTIEKAAAPQTK